MREARGNLWDYPADWRVITTNGFVRRDGGAVMGRGCALEAKQKFPGFEFELGKKLQTLGNEVHVFPEQGLITFPVKHDWSLPASIPLITRSAAELAKLAEAAPDQIFVMPRPGCGNGRLQWELVREEIERILPDNVVVITF